MRVVLVFLAGVVVGGLVVYLLGGPSVDVRAPVLGAWPQSRSVDAAPSDAAVFGLDSERRVQGRATSLPAVSERPVSADLERPGFAELSAELERLLDSGAEPGREVLSTLRALARLDDPRGLDLVLDCMREACLGRRAADYAKVLDGVRDARIVDAATEALEANLAVYQSSWPYTWGFFDIIAAQGGETAAAVLLRHLDPEGLVGYGAARAVARLDEPDLARAFLERLRTDDLFLVVELAKSLASWGDPGVVSELLEIGFGDDLGRRRRDVVLCGTAEGLPSEFAAEFIARVEVLSDARARADALSSLGYLGESVLGTTAKPTILAALGSADPTIARAALRLVSDHEVLHTTRVESLLAAWLPTITDPALHGQVMRTLVRVRDF